MLFNLRVFFIIIGMFLMFQRQLEQSMASIFQEGQGS